MESERLDPTKGYVNQLCGAMDQLGKAISTQGIGVSEKLDHASFRIEKALGDATTRLSETVKTASDASERYAKSLAHATWALAGTTIVLVLITAANVYVVAK